MKLLLTVVLNNGKQLVGRVRDMTPEEIATRMLDEDIRTGHDYSYIKGETEAGARVDLHVARDQIAALVIAPEQAVTASK